MTHALNSAVAEAIKLPPEEQDILAAEALADFKAGKTKPLEDL